MRFFAAYTTAVIPVPTDKAAELLVDSYDPRERDRMRAMKGKYILIRKSTLHGLFTEVEAAHAFVMQAANRDQVFGDGADRLVINPTTHPEGKAWESGDQSIWVERRTVPELLEAIEEQAGERKAPIITVCQVAYIIGENHQMGAAAGVQAVDVDDATGNETLMLTQDNTDQVILAGVFSHDYMRHVWKERLVKHHKSVSPVKTTIFSMSKFEEAFAMIQRDGHVEVDYINQATDEHAQAMFWLFVPNDVSNPMHSASAQD